jgi:MOSC domain-containing protein YiiM
VKLVSVSTGLPRQVVWHGRSVTTGIFKQPVQGRVALRKLNLDGDRQADLTVHGGEFKAVYSYPFAHYDYWKTQLPGRELPMGSFGEKFTTEGLTEDSVHIGDRFSIGSAEVVVTQPRLPCYKLGVRFQSDDMVKRFLASGRTGFYFAVTREGEVGSATRSASLVAIQMASRFRRSLDSISRKDLRRPTSPHCTSRCKSPHCPIAGKTTSRIDYSAPPSDEEIVQPRCACPTLLQMF